MVNEMSATDLAHPLVLQVEQWKPRKEGNS